MTRTVSQYDPAVDRHGLQVKKKTATGAAGAATCHAYAGKVTTEALTTAAGAEGSYTVTNNKVKTTSVVLVVIENGTNSTVAPALCSVTPGNGSFVVTFTNTHASSALNGTLKIGFIVH